MKPCIQLAVPRELLSKPGAPFPRERPPALRSYLRAARKEESAGESCGSDLVRGCIYGAAGRPPPPPAPSPQPDLERTVVTRSISPRLPPPSQTVLPSPPPPARKQLEVVVIVMAWSEQGLIPGGGDGSKYSQNISQARPHIPQLAGEGTDHDHHDLRQAGPWPSAPRLPRLRALLAPDTAALRAPAPRTSLVPLAQCPSYSLAWVLHPTVR